MDKNTQVKYSINWGHLIHDIMSEINTKDDIDRVLSTRLKRGIIDQENVNRIKDEITSILNNVKITHLFKPNLNTFSEYNILSKDGQVLRPDRVVVHSKESVSLIDYKTGEKRTSHHQQMKKYEQILLEMGYKNIEKYLVYLTESDVEKL